MNNKKNLSQWRDQFYNNGILEILDLLNSQFQDYLYCSSKLLVNKLDLEENHDGFVVKNINNNSTPKFQYGSHLSESFLQFLTPFYSEISQKNLIPTYSYFRHYNKGSVLTPHVDRPSCQYSATIQVNASENKVWPIHFFTKNKEVAGSTGGLFSIIFYKGEDILHWREPLEYDYSSHLFLHWVDRDDPKYKPYHFDGRKGLFSPSKFGSPK